MSTVQNDPSVYQDLAASFDHTFHDTRGGVDLEYITGEQCITRLNEVLGWAGWSFEVAAHGINTEADEVWVMGRLTAGGCTREQFGSQKLRRSRSSGAAVDLGFDLKGAATDALKKCAMSFGVGLYLSRKDPGGWGAVPHRDAPDESSQGPGPGPAAPLVCAECGRELTLTNFKDGSSWSPQQLAGFGRRKHGRVLCMDHYRAANELKRRAEQAMDETPF